MSSDSAIQAQRLGKQFNTIIDGKASINKANWRSFLEAIRTHPDPLACLSRLTSSSQGLSALRTAMAIDPSPGFLNGLAAAVIDYFSQPDLVLIGSGSPLRQVLMAIVDPPFFWNAFLQAYCVQPRKLEEKAEHALAWLLLQLLSFPSDSLPSEHAATWLAVAEDESVIGSLMSSDHQETRFLGEKIKHLTSVQKTGAVVDIDSGPGGRHDNDRTDFREIAIVPTADELACNVPPFLRVAAVLEDPVYASTREADYIDNLFRLGREDLLYDIREEIQIATKRKQKAHRSTVIDDLRLYAVHQSIGVSDRGRPKPGSRWTIALVAPSDIPQLKVVGNVVQRKKWLSEDRNKWFLRHASMACILVNDKLIALATIVRDEDALSEKPPRILLRLEGEANIVKALLRLRLSSDAAKLVQIDTALFAHQPVLKALQTIQTIPLSDELLFWTKDSTINAPSWSPYSVASALAADPTQDLKKILNTSKSIILDKSQHASLMQGLTQSLSLIQGPPGTGKSFIGSLLAKIIHDCSQMTVLVVCYTNHALDQFLEDLLDIGIPDSSIVRFGGKSTSRTEQLSLHKIQQNGRHSKFGRDDWTMIDKLKADIQKTDDELVATSSRFQQNRIQFSDILDFLEFEEPETRLTFLVPTAEDGMQPVTKRGKPIRDDYLLYQWFNGWDAGIFKQEPTVQDAPEIWNMPLQGRRDRYGRWQEAILREQTVRIYDLAKNLDRQLHELERKFDEGVGVIARSKRIIAGTTTGVAKFSDVIRATSPDVLLVEEAGEIQESHIITALAPETKQLILIGDHKQLRPKVNNYGLTVEKGDGYDLNRSLFERMVLKGFPHQVLLQQHRMRPEISALVRHLTYPDLMDAPSTQSRDAIRGVQCNVAFIHHEKPEGDLEETHHLKSADDMSGSRSSKVNNHEAAMVLKIVRYLGQQGYGTDKLVVLTPYLGQLRALQRALQTETDPILNDLDSADLVRAGLISSAAAKLSKKPIRLATVDNYQGEESDIVVASLTRSNPDNSIGFMRAQERVNVLLSRARNGLIMIGNANTFQNARQGGQVWKKLFAKLREGGYVHDGLPVMCERHRNRKALLSSPDDFDQLCPDGGCTQACGANLSCGHPCPSKCHQIYDHSKMSCERILYDKCSNGHQQQWQCHSGRPDQCKKCEKDKKDADKKAKAEFERQELRDQRQREHDRKIAELDAELDKKRDLHREAQLAKAREAAIEQKKADLRDATASADQTHDPHPAASDPIPGSTPASVSLGVAANRNGNVQASQVKAHNGGTPSNLSEAEADWNRQKTVDGASNAAIDAIIGMTGLEQVKQQVLAIKAKVDIAQRQSLTADGRYNVALLGNPGTGKTTVARHYGRFLASMQVISGTEFLEKTGSGLANEGVNGAKKVVDSVLKAGGGTIFIDEAYQLTSSHNFGGKQVLDFFLTEMENNRGKIVFIVAGYTKEMESFFEHNPGLPSRVPHQLRFEDYTDTELMIMLERVVERKWGGRMKVEGSDGLRGLYGRIAIKRLGRGRGRPGFGNARDLENLLDRIMDRQARRLKQERAAGDPGDDFLLLKEDLIGPDPSDVMVASEAYEKLQGMIGLEAVKDTVDNLFDMVKRNYQRELAEKEPDALNLNRVFIGPPGTGKTTVAKLYGRILANLGMLSNGEVMIKNPADFIGSALGESENKTKGILASTAGKVLVIDEAYMLYSGSDTGGTSDPYKTAVIDTIVAEVQSTPGEDRCVLLLGYKDEMERMFQNVNPGLSRRFAMEDAFVFESYTDAQLLQALRWKLKAQDRTATTAAESVAIGVLSRLRNRPNFGNIGEVENLLGKAKLNFQRRMKGLPKEQRDIDAPFEPQDFDPDYDRDKNASENLDKLFEDVVGCESTVQKLRECQQLAAIAKARNKDPRASVPTTFVFKGPPGTGKTTTARKIGQVYYDMGFLSSTEVIECSASDLVGQYVGQTGPKTQKLFRKALGRVLFVDEAYRLSEGHFAKEAMDELVSLLTQETFQGKLIVILAGYDREMNELLKTNPGLGSRFPNEIQFNNLSPSESVEVLRKVLAKDDVVVHGFEDDPSPEYAEAVDLLVELSSLPSWGNARDLQTLAKQMITRALLSAAGADARVTLPDEVAIKCISDMLAERLARETNLPTRPELDRNSQLGQILEPPRAPAPRTTQTTKPTTKAAPPEAVEDGDGDETAKRDKGVTDQVWAELQAARRAEEEAERRRQEEARALEDAARKAAAQERKCRDELADLEQRAAQATHDQELMRLREEARLRDFEAKRRQAEAEEEAKKRWEMEQRRRKEEAKAQAKLREMGVCPVGYKWIKMSGGYRCAGGSHWVDDAALGL